MSQRIRTFAIALLAVMLLTGAFALAENMISTTVVMRVSHMTRSAVANVGEDLSMEVNIEGVSPSSYQWYFENKMIEGANQKVYSIVNAQLEDSGVYRMDAFDESGKMLVSMDISARVIDDATPKSGDDSLPLALVLGTFGAAAAALLLVFRRRRQA